MPRSNLWKPTKAAHLVSLAEKEVGKAYRWGAEGPPRIILATWDCSELVQHMLALVGVDFVSDDRRPPRLTPIEQFDGAWLQWERSHHIPLEAGIRTPGALLFIQSKGTYSRRPYNIGHVAISVGNGSIIEARGKAYGVTQGPVRSSFKLASKVRELYTPALIDPSLCRGE